jgi:hypothetical protein
MSQDSSRSTRSRPYTPMSLRAIRIVEQIIDRHRERGLVVGRRIYRGAARRHPRFDQIERHQWRDHIVERVAIAHEDEVCVRASDFIAQVGDRAQRVVDTILGPITPR